MGTATRNTSNGEAETRRRSPNAIIDLWILRVLVPLRGHRQWARFDDFCDGEDLVERFGLLKPDGKRRLSRENAISAVRLRHAEAEKEAATARLPKSLARNCSVIGKQIGLDLASQRILAFVVLLNLDDMLQEATDLLGELNHAGLCLALAGILKLPSDAVNHALSSTGPLIQSGLIRVSETYAYRLRIKLDLVNAQFAGRMMSAIDNPIDLFRDTLLPAPAAQLTLDDFEHLHLVDVSLALLRKALAERRQGVNLFIHGRPGTGKSEFSRALSEGLGAALLQVSSEDEDGDPIGGEKRLRAFRAALHLVARGNTLLVFDEAEDVFAGGTHPFSPPSAAQQNKAWINRMLESNPVPCLWLSNSTRNLDPAFIRRFDLVFEMPIPPKRQRGHVIRGLCDDLVSTTELDRLTDADHLAPAIVARAVDVARSVRTELASETTRGLVTRLVDQTLIAQGDPPLRATSRAHHAFDPVCAPTGTDLASLARGIAGVESARLCLYGPPGTGKTAFAHWLAERVDRPLEPYRVSDLVDPYVGQSERRLAEVFRRATQTGAVLLLDEVDSFLYDRREAKHSWEVTLVNELLTQTEAFGGIFLAATNRMDQLDPAALRRFDLKLRFEYLRPEQAWRLLRQYAALLGLRSPRASLKPGLASLTTLTPGDFATVARRARFQPLTDIGAFVDALRAECALKPDRPSRPIGFVSAP